MLENILVEVKEMDRLACMGSETMDERPVSIPMTQVDIAHVEGWADIRSASKYCHYFEDDREPSLRARKALNRELDAEDYKR